MPLPDYYELLGVSPTVSQAELKQAYYLQAKKYHPDLNADKSGAEERFKQVAEAYRILSNTEERRLYDEAREREARYVNAPELAGMQRVARFSARRGRRSQHERPTHRRRFGMLPMQRRMPRWALLLMALFWGSALLPLVLSTGGMSFSRSTPPPKKEKEDPPEEVVRERLSRMRADLEQAAAAGDARAQLRLGLLLYSGSAGVSLDRHAAREWWQKAAAQGNKAAAYYLQHSDFTQPAPKAAEEPEPAQP